METLMIWAIYIGWFKCLEKDMHFLMKTESWRQWFMTLPPTNPWMVFWEFGVYNGKVNHNDSMTAQLCFFPPWSPGYTLVLWSQPLWLTDHCNDSSFIQKSVLLPGCSWLSMLKLKMSFHIQQISKTSISKVLKNHISLAKSFNYLKILEL